MPYTSSDVPQAVKNLPSGAQALYRKCFNGAWRDSKDETTARQAGWRCVKNEYTKISEGNWKAKK